VYIDGFEEVILDLVEIGDFADKGSIDASLVIK